MSWHLASSLEQLRAEVNALWPNRSTASDGTIGDAAHSARTSDHNPNSRGSVNAIDITASGIDTAQLIAAAKAHPSVRYIIHNRQIMNRDIGAFRPRPYKGRNPHTLHVHISIYQSKTAEDRTQSWGLADATPGSTGGSTPRYTEIGPGDLIKPFSKGEEVERWQRKGLGYTGKDVDGYHGPNSVEDTKKLQRAHGMTGAWVDGIVGPKTWELAGKPLPKSSAPAFPLPAGHWFGPESKNPKNHSGYYAADRPHIRTWQQQMKDRGWTITVDGRFGDQSHRVATQFQEEKGLRVDGGVGIETWDASWEEPIT